MLLKEILEDIDLMVPNSIATNKKIRYINQVQRQLARDYPLPARGFYFVTEKDVVLYPLPDDCRTENVISVTVNEREYQYKSVHDDSSGLSYSFADGQLLIQPNPTGKTDGYVYYNASPMELTEADLSVEPDFPVDFHDLLVLGCAQKIAFMMKDYELSNQLDMRYHQMASEAIQKLNRVIIKRVRVVRGWG